MRLWYQLLDRRVDRNLLYLQIEYTGLRMEQ